jgi:hypothetical protein
MMCDPTPEAGRWALRLRGDNGSFNNVPKRFGYPIGRPLRSEGRLSDCGAQRGPAASAAFAAAISRRRAALGIFA